MSSVTNSLRFKLYIAVSIFLAVQALVLYMLIIPSHIDAVGVMIWDFYTGAELMIVLLTALIVWVYSHKDTYAYKGEYFLTPLGNLVLTIGGLATSGVVVLWVVWFFPGILALLHLD